MASRRLFIRFLSFPILLFLLHMLGFAYAHYGRWAQLARNPLFVVRQDPEPFLPLYLDYLSNFLRGDWGLQPGTNVVSLRDLIVQAGLASGGLILIAFLISAILGGIIGLMAIRTEPPGVAKWVIPISTISLAMPGFYIGATIITASVFYLLYSPTASRGLPYPLGGFGWDDHLILPVLTLTIRPTMQIAQTTATLLTNELRAMYVTAARSLGYSWRRVIWRAALKNVLAAVVLTIASSLRMIVGEVILVETLFGWPGLGRLFAMSIRPPDVANIFGATLPANFLHPPLIALLATAFGLFFLLIDLISTVLTKWADPRLRGSKA